MNRDSRSIVLVGMMGAGKSVVGRCLQQRTGLTRFDIDEIVSSQFGISIPEIFSTHGEDKFRETETEVLRRISTDQRSIIVTGGGIVLREKNSDLLKRLGTVVWLVEKEEALFNRASRAGNRPLLQGKNPRKAFAEMLQARLPLYAKVADLRVDTWGLTDEEVAVAILTKLRQHR